MADLNRRFTAATNGATASALHFGFVQIGTDCGPSLHTFRTRLGQCNNNRFWPNSFMATAMDLPNNMQSGAPAVSSASPGRLTPHHQHSFISAGCLI
jgi:hypothetical protein